VASAALSILDVGQGDCVVLHDPEHGEAVLIDCPTGRGQVALDFLTALTFSACARLLSLIYTVTTTGNRGIPDQLAPEPENLWLTWLLLRTTLRFQRDGRLSKMSRFAKRRNIERKIPRSDTELICDRYVSTCSAPTKVPRLMRSLQVTKSFLAYRCR